MQNCGHTDRAGGHGNECHACVVEQRDKLRADKDVAWRKFLDLQRDEQIKSLGDKLAATELQNDDLRGEIVKIKIMCAEWENRTLNPSQVESIWGICHNALTMHGTNEKRLAWCDNCKVHYGPWGHDKDGRDCSQFG